MIYGANMSREILWITVAIAMIAVAIAVAIAMIGGH
jgi:hypothetical protein